MKGRKPKPTQTHLSAGDPSHLGIKRLRERQEREVQPTRGLPGCPRHLRRLARDAWKFWAEELRRMNLDARPDAMMLEGACVNYARAVEADRMVRLAGMVVEDPVTDAAGQVHIKLKLHPAVAISNAAWRQVRGFCSEFGLSPLSRTRLTIEKPDTSSQDLMEMLTQPREPRKPPSVH
jgi:P27 family predicted phage terminase small subunit